MLQTPESIMSGANSTPRDSSSARAAWTSSTRSASGFVVVRYSIPNFSDSITAIVKLPVSNSTPGIWP
jgi:hypothetical protein